MRRMKLREQLRPFAPKVPTASMADIAFLLIIFFMLTTTFSPERTEVKLPESEFRTEVSKEAAIIAITTDGELFFTDGEMPSFQLTDASEVGSVTRELVSVLPTKEFVIKADRMVPYRVIDDVLDQLRTNGAIHIGLLTDQRPEEDS